MDVFHNKPLPAIKDCLVRESLLEHSTSQLFYEEFGVAKHQMHGFATLKLQIKKLAFNIVCNHLSYNSKIWEIFRISPCVELVKGKKGNLYKGLGAVVQKGYVERRKYCYKTWRIRKCMRVSQIFQQF